MKTCIQKNLETLSYGFLKITNYEDYYSFEFTIFIMIICRSFTIPPCHAQWPYRNKKHFGIDWAGPGWTQCLCMSTSELRFHGRHFEHLCHLLLIHLPTHIDYTFEKLPQLGAEYLIRNPDEWLWKIYIYNWFWTKLFLPGIFLKGLPIDVYDFRKILIWIMEFNHVP